MYFVKYGQAYLHDPRVDGCMLLDLSLDCDENSCGYCDFTIYPNHPMYDKLRERDPDNHVEVYDDEIKLFSGFIYELGKEFYLDGHVKCKGELDYLNESIVRPYSTVEKGYGTTVSNAASMYFKWLIDQHNSQVKDNKRFTIGINQLGSVCPNNIIEVENTAYPRTMDEIKDKLLDVYGGYLVVRSENGIRYIDYIAEWTDVNSQVLEFGVNLTDYTQIDNSEELATYIVPLGANMSETEYEYDDGYFETEDAAFNANKIYYTKTSRINDEGDTEYSYSEVGDDVTEFEAGVIYYEYDENEDESSLPLTVEGVSNATYDEGYKKSEDLVYNEPAVNKYGWIPYEYKNQDIFNKFDLIDAAILELKKHISPKRTIEIKAVDMHLIKSDLKPICIGEYVRVCSRPHNLDSYFLCVSIDLDLNNPDNSLYTLGTTYDTLTGQQNKRINALNSMINKQYEDASKVTNAAKKAADNANKAAKLAVVSVVEEYTVTESIDTPPSVSSEWTTVTPSASTEGYIWRRIQSTYGDGTVETSEASCLVGNSGQNGEDAVLLRIDSSRGTVFKNDSISTVLSVVIYKGSERITDITALHSTFGSGAYLEWSWQRIDENAFGTILSSDSMISNDGFNLTISANEVDTKVTFMCQLKV